jgi:hypothetical protein
MRRRSKSTAATYREMDRERREFEQDFPCCMFCGARGVSTHEIFAGSFRLIAFKIRACWLSLCSDCNCNQATDHALWPWERQLAVKLEHDPFGFNMADVDKVLGNRRVDWVKVLSWFARHRQNESSDAA